jgi:hypothetical protein
LSKIVQVVVACEQGIAGESIGGRSFQPFGCLPRVIDKGESGGDVIGRVVKVPESLALFYS